VMTLPMPTLLMTSSRHRVRADIAFVLSVPLAFRDCQ